MSVDRHVERKELWGLKRSSWTAEDVLGDERANLLLVVKAAVLFWSTPAAAADGCNTICL